MPNNIQMPEETEDNRGKTLNHPAFGVVEINKVMTNKGIGLFGSRLKHDSYINITISTGYSTMRDGVERQFGNDGILSFSLSEAQWAQMISSIGIGNGTPVTLNKMIIDGKYQSLPGVEYKTIKKQASEDMRKEADKLAKNAKDAEEMLKAMLAPGAKPPRKEDLNKLLDHISHIGHRASDSIKHMENMFHEVVDDSLTQAKIDIEAHLMNRVMELGLSAASEKLLTHLEAPEASDGDKASTFFDATPIFNDYYAEVSNPYFLMQIHDNGQVFIALSARIASEVYEDKFLILPVEEETGRIFTQGTMSAAELFDASLCTKKYPSFAEIDNTGVVLDIVGHSESARYVQNANEIIEAYTKAYPTYGQNSMDLPQP